MAVTVETLEKLERKITLSVPLAAIQSEVETRLKKVARTVKMDGFRPGKVPMNVVAQRYGYSVQYEVLNDKVGEAFAKAVDEAGLRVAGQPRISEKEGAAEGEAQFDAIFEVFPEVKLGDLAAASVDKLTAEVDDVAIDKTVDSRYPIPEPVMPARLLRAMRLMSAESTVQETAVAITMSRTMKGV